MWNSFQNLLFQKLLAQSGDQTDIFWKFYSPADTLWSPKTVGRVLGYTIGFDIRVSNYWKAHAKEFTFSVITRFKPATLLKETLKKGIC